MPEAKEKRKKNSLLEKLVPILLVASIILAFVVGVLWQKVSNLESGSTKSNTTQTQGETQTAPQTQASLDQIKGLFSMDLVKFGDANNKVLFVEVSDPSCPYCHIAAGKDPELNKQAGDRFTLVADGGEYIAPGEEMRKLIDAGKASFVYIYQNGHGNGEMGAKALYCAYDEGKFWEVSDLLMSNKGYDLVNNTVKNDKTKSGDLADFLSSVIDKNKMKECLDSGKYDERITSDMQLATSLGVGGTPGFYVNDKFYGGAYSWTDNMIDPQTKNQIPNSSMEEVVNSLLK